MKKFRARVTGILLLLLLAGGAAALTARSSLFSARVTADQEETNTLLVPCSRFTEGFSRLPFTSLNFTQWPALYHGQVGKVVEEHLRAFSRPAVCTAESAATALEPGPELRRLALLLPTWKNRPVSQADAGVVLLEFLRGYECALHERSYFRATDALETLRQKAASRGSSVIDRSEHNAEMTDEARLINRELAVARPALHRTLALIGGILRFLPLHGELQCIERTSLDIRNAVALSAETASCLPRIWNAKDPLRDL